MKEYIEREKAKQILADDYAYAAANLPDTVPTADVQEVRHGKNITDINPVDEFICSECGFACEDLSGYDKEEELYYEYDPNYCPYCGAKMDKE